MAAHNLKKLETMNESNEKLGQVKEKTNSQIENNQEIVPVEIDSEDENNGNANIRTLPIKGKISILMTETLGFLMKSRSFLKLSRDEFGGTSISRTHFFTSSGDRININDIIHDLPPEIFRLYLHYQTLVKL